MPLSQTWTVHCDGSAEPNPGRMGMGAVIVAPDGARHTLSLTSSERGCNNEAELRALLAALRSLEAAQVDALQIYSDNSVLVAQLDGHLAQPPVARLAGLFDEARALLATFSLPALKWIPRHRNGEADALARAAIGLPPKPTKMPIQGKASRRRRQR
ncbi:MAG TPA: reverse transcriptase-like protein [Aquabacterium sp.]|uniref:reverse transcriptase-like protein n=1 Tax=Aquabacterium sp. TaxID=1872578 RepID=UPI002E35230B|nr:reverse transcriptase-like protein [Aquabacterium sp.]HEX5356092.1 reverse transcriptase-like protein [Aquabacterium sp.]